MKVGKKGNDYSGRAVEKKTPVKTVLRAIIIFAVYCNAFDPKNNNLSSLV